MTYKPYLSLFIIVYTLQVTNYSFPIQMTREAKARIKRLLRKRVLSKVYRNRFKTRELDKAYKKEHK